MDSIRTVAFHVVQELNQEPRFQLDTIETIFNRIFNILNLDDAQKLLVLNDIEKYIKRGY